MFVRMCLSANRLLQPLKLIVRIVHDVWLGSSSIVFKAVTIGDGAVVGVNSFVNKDVDPYTIIAGPPARTTIISDA